MFQETNFVKVKWMSGFAHRIIRLHCVCLSDGICNKRQLNWKVASDTVKFTRTEAKCLKIWNTLSFLPFALALNFDLVFYLLSAKRTFIGKRLSGCKARNINQWLSKQVTKHTQHKLKTNSSFLWIRRQVFEIKNMSDIHVSQKFAQTLACFQRSHGFVISSSCQIRIEKMFRAWIGRSPDIPGSAHQQR